MVRKKKETIRPVVAKPLNDTEKRNLITSFVTSTVNESVTKDGIDNVTDDVTKYNADNVTKIVTNYDTKSVTNVVTNIEAEHVTNNDTISVTNNDTEMVTNTDTLQVTKKVTEKDTKSVTKKVTKDVIIIKTISLGKKDIIAKFTSTKHSRPNYNLSEDTIEKIEKISDILGYKKAEFVDIYLNGTLTKVLADLEKNNK